MSIVDQQQFAFNQLDLPEYNAIQTEEKEDLEDTFAMDAITVTTVATVKVSSTITSTIKSTIPSSTVKSTTSTVVSPKSTSVTPKSTSTAIVSVTASQSSISKTSSVVSSSSRESTTSTTPTPTPTPMPDPDPVYYPTEIDTELLIFCFNNPDEASCVDLFRLIHFFLSARLNSDPILVQYLSELGIDMPETDIVTATSTSTTSVSLYHCCLHFIFLITSYISLFVRIISI